MISNRSRLYGFLVVTLLLASAGGTQAERRSVPIRVGAHEGGGLPPDPPTEHPSEAHRLLVEVAIGESVRALEDKRILSEATLDPPVLGWPLAAVNGLRDFGYHTTFHLVDLDPAFPDHVLDYACGARSYDTLLGYSHRGADYVVWPFRWTRFRDSQLAVVAAAPGTIVFREDGTPDFHCATGSSLWNAVYVRHADGSVAWYGHLKNGSLTAKGIGEAVSRGEYLGLVGASGAATGPHLHFEVHDSLGDVIEPHEGPCNAVPSWWANQRPYFDSAINKLTTGPALPIPYSACPGGEEPNEAIDFEPGSTIYFTTYYRDQRGIALDPRGATTEFAIYGPDGTPVLDWAHTGTADHYVGSWWSFEVSFPEGVETGIYRWEAVYQGARYAHYFSVGGPTPPARRPERVRRGQR